MMRAFWMLLIAAQTVLAAPSIPEPLKPWAEWVQQKKANPNSPPSHAEASKRMPLWVSELKLDVTNTGATFSLRVNVFDEAWLELPGSEDYWPQSVQVESGKLVVIARGAPVTKLSPGGHVVTGKFQWSELPERLSLPREIGIIRLTVDGVEIPAPNWDEAGWLWLKRQKAETTDRDFMSTKIYRLLEDGQPMWLRTIVELSVAGKSREEDLGQLLPEGWKMATVDSALPTLVDESGKARAQVRAGKWTIKLDAFRTEPQPEISYPAGAKRLVDSELVALAPSPQLRMIELKGVVALDVNQTTFPEQWRRHPLYQWDNKQPIKMEEKMRGMGLEQTAGLKVFRTLWLDDDGKSVTFQDRISGQQQRLWRLDAAAGQRLGAAKMDEIGQLITQNPNTGDLGVEVRQPMLEGTFTGRADVHAAMPAVGWKTTAQSLKGRLHIPPGWRLIALFGPDSVDGDWLTQWTLLDVFLLLVFSMAVLRLWGWLAGITAFFTFILSYHEIGAPRWSWLWLVMMLALIRMLPLKGIWQAWGNRLRLFALVFLAWRLVLFVQYQVTGLLYPQLEVLSDPGKLFNSSSGMVASSQTYADFLPGGGGGGRGMEGKEKTFSKDSKMNLNYDKQVKIQTGPALPSWDWREATFSWRGPVSMKQTMHPILLSSFWQRALIVVRLGLIGALLWLLLRKKNTPPKRASISPPPATTPAIAAAVLGLLWMSQPSASAQNFPTPELLADLEKRLNEVDDAFPNAATIPTANITLKDGKISMQLEVHAATSVAIPLPGRVPAWSPVTILLDGQPAIVKRQEGLLWVVVPQGVHQCSVEGLAPGGSEWEWAFPLRPGHLTVDAPGWNITGLRPTGVPEAQIFFVQQVVTTEKTAAYDRREFNPIVQISRHLELGLVWQVRTEVKRLTPSGKAISLSLPLLSGERLLTSGLVAQNGRIEARLGSQEDSFIWESELPMTAEIRLTAEKSDRWVERWMLEASPVWNVTFTGLYPSFFPTQATLSPVWTPWPGESTVLQLKQPVAMTGETLTVHSLTQKLQWGKQQRTNEMTLALESSLGQDLALTLPPGAEISSVILDQVKVPARKTGDQWIIGIRPGQPTLEVKWTLTKPLITKDAVEPVILPVDVANTRIELSLPRDRWVLWTTGPQHGPAVRFWGVILAALLFAVLLGKFTRSPLKWWHWALLLTGMTQVDTAATFVFVAWVLLLSWRGRHGAELSCFKFRALQIVLFVGAGFAAITLLWILRNGLLGSPRMIISGEESTAFNLNWYQPRSGQSCPTPQVFSVSIWVFRSLMLIWALWLAWAVLGWIRWAWDQFTSGGWWKEDPHPVVPPPRA